MLADEGRAPPRDVPIARVKIVISDACGLSIAIWDKRNLDAFQSATIIGSKTSKPKIRRLQPEKGNFSNDEFGVVVVL